MPHEPGGDVAVGGVQHLAVAHAGAAGHRPGGVHPAVELLQTVQLDHVAVARGKKLKGFEVDGTRPTMDRVKESLFGMIQSYVGDSRVLDLFAGSGALGLEAISNGAREAYLVDNNIEAIKVIRDNIKNMDDDIKVIKSDYKKFLKETDEKFDIIFLDPPYRKGLMGKALRVIEERDLLNEGGLVVCEYEYDDFKTNLDLFKEKSYGFKKIKIFKR